MFSKRQKELYDIAGFIEFQNLVRTEFDLHSFTKENINKLERFVNNNGVDIYHIKDITLSQINRRFRFHEIPTNQYDESVLSYFEAIREIHNIFEMPFDDIHKTDIQIKFDKVTNKTKVKELAFFYFYAGSYWTHVEQIKYWRTPLVINFIKGFKFNIHPGRTRLKISSPIIRNSKTDVILFKPHIYKQPFASDSYDYSFDPNSIIHNERFFGGFGKVDLQVLNDKQMEIHSYGINPKSASLVPELLIMKAMTLKWNNNTMYINDDPLITVEPFKMPIWHKLPEYHLVQQWHLINS